MEICNKLILPINLIPIFFFNRPDFFTPFGKKYFKKFCYNVFLFLLAWHLGVKHAKRSVRNCALGMVLNGGTDKHEQEHIRVLGFTHEPQKRTVLEILAKIEILAAIFVLGCIWNFGRVAKVWPLASFEGRFSVKLSFMFKFYCGVTNWTGSTKS